MKENRSWDHLNMLSKDEIIEFVKTEMWFQAPELRSVAYFRYNKEFNRILKLQKEHLDKKNGSKWAKLIDENAGKINAETDISKKLKLFDEREKLIKQYNAVHKEYEKLDKKLEAIQKWYDKISKE